MSNPIGDELARIVQEEFEKRNPERARNGHGLDFTEAKISLNSRMFSAFKFFKSRYFRTSENVQWR